MNNLKKSLFVTILLLTCFSRAARIVEARWNSDTQKIRILVAYQGGCETHNFSVKWEMCEMDMNTQLNSRFGQLLDSGAHDSCGEELQQTLVISEPNDGCVANTLVLKSTSSKIPFVLSR